MKNTCLFTIFFAVAQALIAMGVSPDKAAQGPVSTGGVKPAPVTGDSISPGKTPTLPPLRFIHKENVEQNLESYTPPDWAKEWGHVTFEQAVSLQKDPSVLFLDARSKEDFENGHIPGALPMPVRDFDVFFPKYKSRLNKAKTIVTYCSGVSCQLADKVAYRLFKEKGIKNVAAFFGGWPKWTQHGMPVEKGMPE